MIDNEDYLVLKKTQETRVPLIKPWAEFTDEEKESIRRNIYDDELILWEDEEVQDEELIDADLYVDDYFVESL